MGNKDPSGSGKESEKRKWKEALAIKFWIIRKRRWLTISLKGLGIITAVFFLLTFSSFGYLYFYTHDLRSDNGSPLALDKLSKFKFKQTSFIKDRHGLIVGRSFIEVRHPLKYAEVPPLLIKGFLAAEDQRFFYSWHLGIDPLAITRAIFFNSLRKLGYNYGSRSGASGIAQQEARLLYSEDVSEFRIRTQTISRKIKEARLAIQLCRHYPKEEVMEKFLNSIYFGHGTNGLDEAYRYYFGKDLSKDPLTLPEIAILASLNKSPSRYCPIFHKPSIPPISPLTDKAEARRLQENYEAELAKEAKRIAVAKDRYNWVLKRMRENKFISSKNYDDASFSDQPLALPALHLTPFQNKDFRYGNRLVKEALLFQNFKEEDISYYGGLSITTTFDQNLQKIANEEFTRHLAILNQELPADQEKLEGAFVVIENKTGQILALSGGHDFSETQFNRLLSGRSPGSGFKPFTYAAALEFAGKTFNDLVCNCPFRMRGNAPGKQWIPRNFREENPLPLGRIPLPMGLIRSINLATLNLAREIGIEPIVDLAHRMGVWGNPGIVRGPDGQILFKRPGMEITDGLVPLLPTAIGASDVNLLEMANAFSIFARDGLYLPPSWLLEIKDPEGRLLYQAKPPIGQRVLSEQTARQITVLLRAVTKIGTAKISMRDIEQPVAVKTGTSNGPNDLSMIGFTPDLTIGIRIGYDQPKPIALPEYMRRASGRDDMQVSGGWVVGPIFRAMVDRIYQQRPRVEFNPAIEEETQNLVNLYGSKYR